MAGLKRVPKYKWLRTETVVVTQGGNIAMLSVAQLTTSYAFFAFIALGAAAAAFFAPFFAMLLRCWEKASVGMRVSIKTKLP